MYPPLTAPGPLEALHRLHADALGNRRVRLEGGRLVFADPAARELCAGVWEITLVAPGIAKSIKILIAEVDPVTALQLGIVEYLSLGGNPAQLRPASRGMVTMRPVGAVVKRRALD